MKKFAFLFTLLTLMLTFTACNDEPDNSTDKQVAKALVGTWHLSETSSITGDDGTSTEVFVRDVVLTFGDNSYNYTWHTKTSTKDVAYSVAGKWCMKKEIMMLNYDLNSLKAQGMSENELKNLRLQMVNSNALYDDLKDGNQVVGMGITVSRSGNVGVLSITNNSDLAGTYNLVKP